MIMDFKPALVNDKGMEVHAIEGFANGSFALKTVANGRTFIKLFDAQGKEVCADITAIIARNRYVEFCRGAVLGERTCLFLQKGDADDYYAAWVEHDKWYESGVNDVYIFANDWFETSAYGIKILHSADGTEMAHDFKQAKVFNLGYALCMTDADVAGNKWELFTLSGKRIRKVSRVAGFVGDGNMLVYGKASNILSLRDFAGKELPTKPIACFENFANGCFVLTFTDGLSRMYLPNGKPLSVEVKDATLLPDGCFVQYEGTLITGVYGPNGILDRRTIYSFEKVSHYYLFSGEFYNGHLFDSAGQKIGEDYVLLKSADNFALFGHNGELQLFNQYGCVFTAKETLK